MKKKNKRKEKKMLYIALYFTASLDYCRLIISGNAWSP